MKTKNIVLVIIVIFILVVAGVLIFNHNGINVFSQNALPKKDSSVVVQPAVYQGDGSSVASFGDGNEGRNINAPVSGYGNKVVIGDYKETTIYQNPENGHQRANENMDAAAVKLKCEQLSYEIIDFLRIRENNEPPSPTRGDWDEIVEAQSRYNRETMLLYSKKFKAQAILLREKLDNLGVPLATEHQLRIYTYPTNTLSVESIANDLSVAAKKIP